MLIEVDIESISVFRIDYAELGGNRIVFIRVSGLRGMLDIEVGVVRFLSRLIACLLRNWMLIAVYFGGRKEVT